jgi:predicted DNA-binding protein (MmcQ/YjbR family)
VHTSPDVTLESFHRFVHSLPAVTEDFPFGPEVLVLRVSGKIFALMSVDALPLKVNLKCDPERAVELRAEYDGVIPGWHMNKKHWNTVALGDDVPGPLLKELIVHSWHLVVAGMPKKAQEPLFSALEPEYLS